MRGPKGGLAPPKSIFVYIYYRVQNWTIQKINTVKMPGTRTLQIFRLGTMKCLIYSLKKFLCSVR